MKILVISSIYPGEGTPQNYTPVVHFFVREWIKLGFDVRVIHTCTYFPYLFYKAPQWLRRIIQSRFGIALPVMRLNKEVEYEFEGVRVYRIPMKKLLPMGSFSNRELQLACNRVESFLERESFHPQYIISHWVNPQLTLMSFLKHKTRAITTMVLHSSGIEITSLYKNWGSLIKDVDIWGYRSIKIQKAFESFFGVQKYSFRCLSGIPDHYLNNVPNRDGIFRNRFAQVGLLIERKFPDKTIEAVSTVYGESNYSLNIVGDGGMRERLETIIKSLRAKDRIHLLGRLPRQGVVSVLDETDVFILISKDEVFGLVYIEAMARGCIVIASRGEGMDGIIVHGMNGYLCESGNGTELAMIINKIRSLSDMERKQISDAAILTSRTLTDSVVARNYIGSVIQFGEEINNEKDGNS